MNTEKDLLILAKSKKYNNYCIAGYDINNDEMVRIISNDPKIHYSVPCFDIIMSNTNTEAALLDLVRLKAKKVNPMIHNPHQVENWEYDNKVRWRKLKSFAINEIPAKCFSMDECLFYNTKHLLNRQDMDLFKTGLKSLQFIDPSFLEFYIKEYEGRIKIYANLKWKGQVYRKLSLTDLHYVSIMEEMYRKFKCEFFFISPNPLLMLSLSGVFEKDLCYYKLIASVITGKDLRVCAKQSLYF
jgi:hypothetical protein